METSAVSGSSRRRLSDLLIDVILAVGLAVAITVSIRTSPPQGDPPDALAYGMGLAIATLALFRRRWPLPVLLASAAVYQVYNLFDYPGIFPAVPLSVSVATAWAAGYVGWALTVGSWFVVAPLGFIAYQSFVEGRSMMSMLGRALPDVAMMGAVFLLGEAVRTRHALQVEQERSQRLLLNVLPASIADRLKDSEDVIADAYREATVMFADLVDFTIRSQAVGPRRMVKALDDLFSTFDALARKHGLEKIKTIGDAYMAAAGVPSPRPDHADAVAQMAIDVRDHVEGRFDPDGNPLSIRIGIDSGPVVAGVIGESKFIYDLWGDTVNTASRMESHGVPGQIQVTERTQERLGSRYKFEQRGPIQVKGKGQMVTYFLLDRA
jgi:class 3 adenylate cyclase